MNALRLVLPTSVVILTVHGIGTPVRTLEPGEDAAWVSSTQFEMVLDAAVGRNDVWITFDDGNASDVEIALPRLLERASSRQEAAIDHRPHRNSAEVDSFSSS